LFSAGVIFFAIFAAHFLTLFGGGLGIMLVVVTICATYYSTSIRRVRSRARDDISRELSKKRLFTDHETADWINNFLSRFWVIYEPVLSATIVASVDQVLSVSTPAFLDSLKMSYFTLGTKAPRVELIRSYPDTEDDVVVMDWKVNIRSIFVTSLAS
jgi:Ca2+-dependent lipid-binding protein